MKLEREIVLSAADTVSQNGAAIPSDQLVTASFQAVFGDATAAGTVQVQASNDVSNQAQNFVPTNWSNIPNASATIASGASALITINVLSYNYIRVIYTSVSGGSSTIVVTMFAVSV